MPHKPPTQLQGVTDLTLVANIKQGLIEGIFDSRSYASRLVLVLGLLDAARRANREADPLPNPFIDGVARLRVVHFFRFAVLPPGRQLLLNVTFDGGWEPYMRLIWGPLGTMLDLIFCHCEDYPLAAASSYDDYIRWVRKHEVPSQFFYADSGGTVADRGYLNQLEAQQRAGGGRAGADLRAAQLALARTPPPQPTPTAVNSAMRSLKGLHGLTQMFGMPPTSKPDMSVPLDDGSVLLRFAQDFVPDLRDWFAQGLFDPGQRFDTWRAPFERERQWLMARRWTRPEKRDRDAPLDPGALQAGILDSPKAPPGRHGRAALVLARVTNAGAALAWLKSSSTGVAGPRLISDDKTVDLSDDQVVCTVALTYPGLQALGVHEDHLAALPGEFIQGMEARAGILGDLRCNHPQQWRRPRAASAPIDLALAHLMIQLRTGEAPGEQTPDRSGLLPRLQAWMAQHLGAESGIEVLAVEAGWSRPPAENGLAPRDHFGYADGISQPRLTTAAGNLYWDDKVKTGEVLVGWINDRGDGPLPMANGGSAPKPSWLDLGSFLVVRKIRQYVERFDGVVTQAAAALITADPSLPLQGARELARAKLMGRGSDGSPLVVPRGAGLNDFDYRQDSDGAQCPFASHVRRANPRSALPGMRPPRILRRGLAYGPPSRVPESSDGDEPDRGVLFMAYNASIAEQFEVVQRWLTGGNSSGVSSSQPDPFLGVPRTGEPTIFRFSHGDQVLRIELGDQPICRLEWGLYAFVPSMALLGSLEDWVARPGPAPDPQGMKVALSASKVPPLDPKRPQVKDEFEDERRRVDRWREVRNRSGVERIGKSVMVGAYEPVMQVLRDDGSTYSASGYGERMEDTLGQSPFGQDDAGAHAGHHQPFVMAVKQALADAVKEEEAYATAQDFTRRWLRERLGMANALGSTEASIDLIALGTELLAGLCTAWFGVVYEKGVTEVGGLDAKKEPMRCPGHFLSLARNVFSAYPNPTVEGLAKQHGETLQKRVPDWVAAARNGEPAPVLTGVLRALNDRTYRQPLTETEIEGIVANVMLGLPATWLGSWGKVLRAWAGDRRLWRLQHELALQSEQRGQPASYSQASTVLREALIATMAQDPVADGIWRTVEEPHMFRGVDVQKGDVVWLGLGSALIGRPVGDPATEDLLFGGDWRAGAERHAPHACPARGLAIGALLGGLAALLQAGELQATASPVVLALKPLKPPTP
jgi:Dyp-type peroxidase family